MVPAHVFGSEQFTYLAEVFSHPGALVIDPMCGSGTTGVATVGAGRRFLGIDIDAQVAAVARDRIAGVPGA